MADGSTSNDADALTYAWTLITRPPGSAATLTDATTVSPRFTVDRPGTYVARLIVHDAHVSSPPLA